MDDRQFGDAGARVVLEECLTGPEVSFFALCDGTPRVPLTTAQDHKRIFDDDEGPNTGGMGAFAPSPLVDDGDAGADHARDRRPGPRRHARRRARVSRLPLRRADADLRRPEGHRVQRPLRRSRSAGRHPDDRGRPRAAPGRGRGRRARPEPPRVRPKPARRRRARVGGLSGVGPTGAADSRVSTRRRGWRMCCLSRRHDRRARYDRMRPADAARPVGRADRVADRRRPRADGRRPRSDVSKHAIERAYEACRARFRFDGMQLPPRHRTKGDLHA